MVLILAFSGGFGDFFLRVLTGTVPKIPLGQGLGLDIGGLDSDTSNKIYDTIRNKNC